jgi:hypothetical protein
MIPKLTERDILVMEHDHALNEIKKWQKELDRVKELLNKL